MAVSLAKEPYVRDARPAPDARMMTGALLLQLQAARTSGDILRNARLSAPAVLALCSISPDDLPRIAPIDHGDPQYRRKRLDDALGTLISTLYAGSACSEKDLRTQVLDVVVPLRSELASARSFWWFTDDMAAALADRLWDSRRAMRLEAIGSAVHLVVMTFAAVIRTLFSFPMSVLASIAGGRDSAIGTIDRTPTTPALPAYSPQVQTFAPLNDPGLLAEMDQSWSAFRRHSPTNRADAVEWEGVDRHFATYAKSFREAWEAGGLPAGERAGSIRTLRTIIGLMDRVSGRVPASPTQGLEALGDQSLLADLARARKALRKHLDTAPDDVDEAMRVEDHLSDLTERFSSTLRSGASISPALRDGTVLAVRSLVASMDAISGRSAAQATQDLETEIRFVISAHGTTSDALQLPPGRMAS